MGEKYKRIIVIADEINIENNTEKSLEMRSDLEQTDSETLNALTSAIKDLGFDYTVYNHPYELATSAASHSKDTVLSIFGGAKTRSRMCLVPAICETFGIDYIGPDAYGRIICQDKAISKSLAIEAGFKVPKDKLIRGINDINSLEKIPLPSVIKPLLEGSSIGISSKSLVHDFQSGKMIAIELLERFTQPILIEQFIPGREVSLNFIQHEKDILWSFSEILIKEQPHYFDNHLFDADEKLNRNLKREVVTINNEIPVNLIENSIQLIESIGNIGYGRIDGKLYQNQFYFLEITPDAWISPKGAFAASYMNYGTSYKNVINNIIQSTRS